MEIGQRLALIHDHPQAQAVLKVVQTLHEQGFLAVLAGGCVRDALLGRSPKDLDVATSATPEDVEKLFPRTLDVGRAFGTMVVVEDGMNFELTTFRRDGPYLDGRHPSKVEFTEMRVDAERRDFTVNALFYDPEKHLIFDFVGGLRDLDEHRLRTVGRGLDRFDEDKLRMLRAVRFVAQLGFRLEQESFGAIQELAPAIRQVAIERVFNEIKRLLEGPFLRHGVEILLASGLAKFIWPELANSNLDLERFSSYGQFCSWESAYAAICRMARLDPTFRLRAWKCSRDSLRRVEDTLSALETLLNTASSVSDRVMVLGQPWFQDALTLASAEVESERIEQWTKEFLAVSDQQGRLPAPLVDGQDLIDHGMAPGAEMGLVLKRIYRSQLEGRIKTKSEALREALKRS